MKRRVLSIAFSSLFLLAALIGLGTASGSPTAHASTASSSKQIVHPHGNTGGSNLFGETNAGLWLVEVWPDPDPNNGTTQISYSASFYIELVFKETKTNTMGAYDVGTVYNPGTNQVIGNYTVNHENSRMVVLLFGPQTFKGELDGQLSVSYDEMDRTVGTDGCVDQNGAYGLFYMVQQGW